MNKDRIMALSDGIVAIAATIMVLELAVPQTITVDSLLSQLPVFYSYVVSFVLIYLAWRSHHMLLKKQTLLMVKHFWLMGSGYFSLH